jgi:hypothetical protein
MRPEFQPEGVAMPTSRQLRAWTSTFESVYPVTLPERLEWWVRTMGVEPCLLLRLMGLSQAEVDQFREGAWPAIVDRWPNEAWWLQEVLMGLMQRYWLDWRELARELHQPLAAARYGLHHVVLPGGHSVPVHELSRDLRTDYLLPLIVNPPGAVWALFAFLSADETEPVALPNNERREAAGHV